MTKLVEYRQTQCKAWGLTVGASVGEPVGASVGDPCGSQPPWSAIIMIMIITDSAFVIVLTYEGCLSSLSTDKHKVKRGGLP